MSPFAGPAEVRGRLETIRNILHPILILIFLLLPWLRLGGEPLFLFDIFNRHFILFGSTFYSHEAPLLFFVLILTILSIFIVTALYGRLWCGWACPQTVFLHSVFNQIEKIFLGRHVKRVLFYKTESSLIKTVQVFLIYFIFLCISWVLSHSFIAYFIGSDIVTQYIVDGPRVHMQAFIVLSIITIILFFNFSIFREKVCFYVCPYGRFQNALIDNNSLTVYYDSLRGEPRGKLSAANVGANNGDCIDCKMCVRACPTKIDIRQGFQLECISCGKCVDACDEVMTKINRPTKLIRYETGNLKKINLKRFRLYLYGILYSVFLIGFIWLLASRQIVEIDISRSRAVPFANRIDVNQKIYVNQFQFHVKNNSLRVVSLETHLSSHNILTGFRLSSPLVKTQLAAQQDLNVPVFIEISEADLTSKHQLLEFTFKITDANGKTGQETIKEYKKTIEFIKVD